MLTDLTPQERHERHHTHLAEVQDRIDRIYTSAYASAKKHNAHAPRKFATRSTHSQRVSQIAAWRSHLTGLHGVKLPTFIGLAEMQAMHDRLHAEEKS